jgi:hypothetical protein
MEEGVPAELERAGGPFAEFVARGEETPGGLTNVGAPAVREVGFE